MKAFDYQSGYSDINNNGKDKQSINQFGHGKMKDEEIGSISFVAFITKHDEADDNVHADPRKN